VRIGAVATPTVLDCDPGIDDAVALLVAAASPALDLVAVTTVGGNASLARTTRNALAVLALAGRPDLPVAAGADRPLVRAPARRAGQAHGPDGLGGITLPEPAARPVAKPAVELLAEVVRRSPEPVTLVATGPLTNVALFYAVYPALATRLGRLVVMAGAVTGGGRMPVAETNVWYDPEAAYRVLSEPGLPGSVPTTVVPLDVTLRVALGRDQLTAMRAAGWVGAVVCTALEAYQGAYRSVLGPGRVPVHDAVAVVEAAQPGLVRAEPRHVEVDTGYGPGRGATRTDRYGGAGEPPMVQLGLDADVPAVVAAVLAGVAAYP
jgi:pyrimidine-specific ribonucleoside hydrolase